MNILVPRRSGGISHKSRAAGGSLHLVSRQLSRRSRIEANSRRLQNLKGRRHMCMIIVSIRQPAPLHTRLQSQRTAVVDQRARQLRSKSVKLGPRTFHVRRHSISRAVREASTELLIVAKAALIRLELHAGRQGSTKSEAPATPTGNRRWIESLVSSGHNLPGGCKPHQQSTCPLPSSGGSRVSRSSPRWSQRC